MFDANSTRLPAGEPAGSDASPRAAMSHADHERALQRWLVMCGLGYADSCPARVRAALADFNRQPALRWMLLSPAAGFRDWWCGQDVSGFALTQACGSDDWAYTVLAMACEQTRHAEDICLA